MTRFNRVEVTRELDSLERTVWIFSIIDADVLLDGYRVERRLSKHHAYRSHPDYRWSRLMNRDNRIKTPPKPPQNVINEAVAEFRRNLNYKEEL